MILSGTAVTDTCGDGGWVPVTVTARLAEPVIGLDAHPCHLDGPAAWSAYLAWTDVHGHCSLPPPGAGRCEDFGLPFATWTAAAPPGAHPLAVNGAGMAWGWACSRALYTPQGHATVNVRKPPAADVASRYCPDRAWDLSSGPLKARDTPYSAVLARDVAWHALADPAALRALLGRVPSLGRLGRHGSGRVLSWTVEEHRDRDAWRDRVFPLPGGSPGAIRAPYWHPARRMPCTP